MAGVKWLSKDSLLVTLGSKNCCVQWATGRRPVAVVAVAADNDVRLS